MPHGEHSPRCYESRQAATLDVVGPFRPSVYKGARYMLNCRDLFSQMIFSYPMQSTTEEATALKSFRNDWFGYQHKPGARLYLDQASYFKHGDFERLIDEWGWSRSYSPPHAHALHPAESMNYVLLRVTRALLVTAQAPNTWWTWAYLTAAYTHNRMTTSRQKITPYELHYGNRPSIDHLRIFGTPVTVRVPQTNSKLEPRGRAGWFVGYAKDASYRTYLIFVAETKQLIQSRDVCFHEYLLITKREAAINTLFMPQQYDDNLPSSRTQPCPPGQDLDRFTRNKIIPPNETIDTQICDDTRDTSKVSESMVPEESLPVPEESLIVTEEPNSTEQQLHSPPPTYTTRSGRKVIHAPTFNVDETAMGAASKFNYPGADQTHVHSNTALAVVSRSGSPAEEKLDTQQATVNQEYTDSNNEPQAPASYGEYLKLPSGSRRAWRESIDTEYGNLVRNGTFEIVAKTPNIKAMHTKWVFTIKSSGLYKARLVVVGTNEPLDSEASIFAPTVDRTSLRAATVMALTNKWEAVTMDVTAAFLHANVDSDILFIEIPKGIDAPPGSVPRLGRSLYGLRSAPRLWLDHLVNSFKSLGFRRSILDQAMFILNDIIVLVYVDDIRAYGPKEKLKKLVENLGKIYDLKHDFSPNVRYLGCEW
mmetsp:Transcript_19300/g.34353  ORF Transcript_19300/g.34353 Transcript_19300/m.34353 type:complete len:649 (+) Transcript_19300:879-2825(+)